MSYRTGLLWRQGRILQKIQGTMTGHEKTKTTRERMDRQINMRALKVWGSNRDTLEFGQVMYILQYWIPKYSFVSYLSISSLHCGAPVSSLGSGKKISPLKVRSPLGCGDHSHVVQWPPVPWVSFSDAASLLPSPLCSSLLSSQASYNIASRTIFLKNKSSHITGQLSDCHVLPVGGEAQSVCLPSLLPFIPWVLPG